MEKKRITIELTPKDQEYIATIKRDRGEPTIVGVIRMGLRNLARENDSVQIIKDIIQSSGVALHPDFLCGVNIGRSITLDPDRNEKVILEQFVQAAGSNSLFVRGVVSGIDAAQ